MKGAILARELPAEFRVAERFHHLAPHRILHRPHELPLRLGGGRVLRWRELRIHWELLRCEWVAKLVVSETVKGFSSCKVASSCLLPLSGANLRCTNRRGGQNFVSRQLARIRVLRAADLFISARRLLALRAASGHAHKFLPLEVWLLVLEERFLLMG